MDKGLLVIAAIGLAIIYFAMHFSDGNDGSDIAWTVESKQEAYEQYYEKDAMGDKVLNLTAYSADRAKSIWPTTPTATRIAQMLPDFALAKTEMLNQVKKGDFQRYLLEYLDDLEGRYLAGELNSDQAKKALMHLR